MHHLKDNYLLILAVVFILTITGMYLSRKQIPAETSSSSTAATTSGIEPAPEETAANGVEPAPAETLPAIPESQITGKFHSSGPHKIERVLDGDTLELDNGEKVRLIGVDTPETHHPELPVQRFSKEAAEFVRRTAEGMECTLEYDPTNRNDAYDRLLAYVYINDRLLNAEIIKRGYGFAYTRFPHARMDEFISYEKEARARQYGLWNYSLSDGRITGLINRYDQLSPEGKKELDTLLDRLIKEYPAKKMDKKEGD